MGDRGVDANHQVEFGDEQRRVDEIDEIGSEASDLRVLRQHGRVARANFILQADEFCTGAEDRDGFANGMDRSASRP